MVGKGWGSEEAEPQNFPKLLGIKEPIPDEWSCFPFFSLGGGLVIFLFKHPELYVLYIVLFLSLQQGRVGSSSQHSQIFELLLTIWNHLRIENRAWRTAEFPFSQFCWSIFLFKKEKLGEQKQQHIMGGQPTPPNEPPSQTRVS